MYRLLKLRKFSRLTSCNTKSTPSSATTNLLNRTCAFCNHNFVLRSPEVLEVTPRWSRNQSTNATNINSAKIIQLKKKKRKHKKRFAELLEVTDKSLSQKKASVSKLTSQHLSLLAEQPDIDLNKLFQLKKLTKSCVSECGATLFIPPHIDMVNINSCIQNTPIPEVSSILPDNSSSDVKTRTKDKLRSKLLADAEPEVNRSVPGDVLMSIPSTSSQDFDLPFDNIPLRSKQIDDIDSLDYQCLSSVQEDILGHIDDHESQLDSEVSGKLRDIMEVSGKESKRKKKKQNVNEQASLLKRKETEQAGKEEALTRSLVAHLDVCVNCGLLSRALSTLHFYSARRKRSDKCTKMSDERPYNVVLGAFAGKGVVNKVKEILRLMDEDEMKWSLQTYAFAFECLGRIEQTPAIMNQLEEWMERLKCSPWELNDVIVKNTFVKDQREITLKAIRWMFPDFQPTYPPPDSCYSCSLLQELNNSEEAVGFKSPGEGVLSLSELKAAVEQQIKLEHLGTLKVKSIERRNDDPKITKYYQQKLSESEDLWRETIRNALERDLNVLRAKHGTYKSHTQLTLYPFLKVLSTDQIVDILMKEIRRLAEGSEAFSPSILHLHRQLGGLIMSQYDINYKQQVGVLAKVEEIYHKYCEWYSDPSGPARNPREQWQLLEKSDNSGPSMDIGRKHWSNVVLCNIGKFLYNIILRDIKVDVNIIKHDSKLNKKHFLPAFYTVFRTHGHSMKEEVKPHPALARLYRGAALDDLYFEAALVPMVSPPVPWTRVSSCVGGYVLTQPDIVRLPFVAYQQRIRMEKAYPSQMFPSLDALNQLGSVPWTVNERVLDVVLEVFNNGGSNRLDIPLPPSAFMHPPVATPEMTSEERAKLFRERINLRRKRAEMYSLWCDALYKLSLSNHFRNKVFWLPHNMDFRGRVYPCAPHLNHLSSDMSRSLLQFAKGEPLGQKGLDWLMIHLINLTGRMKRESVQERLEYARSVISDILDSAKNPLKGRMWWATNEEPWQVLATCMEIEKAVESGNPQSYISRFPVHQDGSCNGLQHYAALGRDRAGAASVNLIPNSHPQDVYSTVATMVEMERAREAAEGVEAAQILEGFVRRKVIKQTVMTTVYGVTKYGARLQIARQLRDIDEFPKEYVWHCSTYLVAKTFHCLREMFTSAREIQDWFTECARQITQVCGQNVEWTTPLGLPVVQPYVRYNPRFEDTKRSQNKLTEHFSMDMYEKPNIMKQKNAFPPNFIHSLDSCHMMLTSIFCEREGITFVSVHDCFWTHPCSVEIMNRICRKQFVALHSEPILEDLSQFLIDKFGYKRSDAEIYGPGLLLNGLLKKIPSKGDFDLTDVLNSVYFFC